MDEGSKLMLHAKLHVGRHLGLFTAKIRHKLWRLQYPKVMNILGRVHRFVNTLKKIK